MKDVLATLLAVTVVVYFLFAYLTDRWNPFGWGGEIAVPALAIYVLCLAGIAAANRRD